MTPQEIIKELNELIDDCESSMCYDNKEHDDLYIKHIEALMIAIQALEKQIPKKPYYEGGFVYDTACCPVCNQLLDYENYCYNYGQALDWSKDDDT